MCDLFYASIVGGYEICEASINQRTISTLALLLNFIVLNIYYFFSPFGDYALICFWYYMNKTDPYNKIVNEYTKFKFYTENKFYLY